MSESELFRQAIADAGLEAPREIIPDGQIHRFSSNGKRGDLAGWYCLYLDGVTAGVFGCWRAGLTQTWSAKNGKCMSRAELEEHRQRIKAAQKAAEAMRKAEQDKAASEACRRWEAAKLADPSHPYLRRKGIKAHGLRREGDLLLVPVWGGVGGWQSLQTISPDGRKRFLPGGKMKGGMFWIGERQAGEPVLLAEGWATAATLHEATGYLVIVAFNAGNLQPVAKELREKMSDTRMIICADNDQGTTGNPGLKKGREAAQAVGAAICWPEGIEGTDFNDMAKERSLEAVADTVKVAMESAETGEEAADHGDDVPPLSLAEAVKDLAKLPPLEYEQHREQEAKRLKVRVGVLDAEVAKERKALGKETGTEMLVDEVEPWPEPVEGTALAAEVRTLLERHAVLPAGGTTAITLWLLGTWVHDAFAIFPKLTITSPEMRCGKTTVLSLVGAIAARAMATSNITAAALFRVIDACKPTLLIDEADTFLAENDELRGVINSGHTKSGAFVVRVVGDQFEPKKFSTWAPMAIAMIKHPPGTILDRSVLVELRRKLPGESIKRLPLGIDGDCVALRQKLARWAHDHMEALQHAAPELPPFNNDRALDNWTPLLSIADLIDWRAQALEAFHLLASRDEEEGAGPMLLEDIRQFFDERHVERAHSITMVDWLVNLEERPWSEWKRGKPMTSNTLSKLLRPYGVKSRSVRIGPDVKKGYIKAHFMDAWDRYIPLPQGTPPPGQNDTTLQTNGGAGFRPIQNVTQGKSVTFQKPPKANDGAGCNVVTFQNGEAGGKGGIADNSAPAASKRSFPWSQSIGGQVNDEGDLNV